MLFFLLRAYSMYATDPDMCVQQCLALLDQPNLDTAVRTGDIYGLLIEHFTQTGDYKQVRKLIS